MAFISWLEELVHMGISSLLWPRCFISRSCNCCGQPVYPFALHALCFQTIVFYISQDSPW